MTLSQEIDAMARDLAEANGRDWSDCGAYERESYKDAARREMSSWIVSSPDPQSSDK